MGKVAVAVFVFCAVAITVGEAFLEPFASKFMAKKMLLKHGFGGVPMMVAPAPAPPKVQYGALFYGGHFEHRPQPSPPPTPQPSFPAYGPQPSYPAYGPQYSYSAYEPQPSALSYGPPSFSGYEQPAQVTVKPHPPHSFGCLPASSPSPQVNYSGYTVHGNYGNNGNNGAYRK